MQISLSQSSFGSHSRLLSLAVLAVGLLVLTACDDNDSGMEAEQELRSVSFDLTAQSNDGALPEGVGGTVTFSDAGGGRTLVTLELEGGVTGADSLAHPAHIHNNSASEGGGIEIFLSPIDGRGGGGTSARLIPRPFDELADFDGHVNVHESAANLQNVVAQGDIGANAEGTEGPGLDLAQDPRSETFDLSANENEGSLAPNGIPGRVRFQEVTDNQTLVTVFLDPGTGDGSTGASVSHPAHIHNNSVSEGGGIEIFINPISGNDPASRSSNLVGEPFDVLSGFDGHVNVHQSNANIQNIVANGNIGANAEGD